ncbi:MAG: methylmalonyl-CoA epimerase [Dehalococcoidales bacterium]|nr:methylmalonyl-CoA epimerase [Dehalococcoidales bacterium]
MYRGVSHIGIAVKDLKEAASAYSALRTSASPVHHMPDMDAIMLAVGDSHLELMSPTNPEGPVGKFIESRGEGIHHICLEVDDIDKEIAALSAQGVRMVDKVARPGIEGKVAFIHPRAMNGVLIELLQKEK